MYSRLKYVVVPNIILTLVYTHAFVKLVYLFLCNWEISVNCLIIIQFVNILGFVSARVFSLGNFQFLIELLLFLTVFLLFSYVIISH